MRSNRTVLVTAGLLALAACAAPPAPKELPPGAAGPELATAGPAAAEEAMTGSRIPRRAGSTDRSVKTVGNRDMRDALDSSARPLER